MRLQKGIFIAGTDTDVGKTHVTAGLAAAMALKLAERVATGGMAPVNWGVWKPVQSGVQAGDPKADSYRLFHGSGASGTEAEVAVHTFSDPLAPWIAARRVSETIDYERLLTAGQRRLAQHDFLFVEGAGGVAVPVTEDKLIADMMADLQLPAVIVARPSLGTVNHTLTTIAFLQQRSVAVLGVILNESQPGQLADERFVRENIEMIERFSAVPVLGVLPWFEGTLTPAGEPQDWPAWRATWSELVASHIDIDALIHNLLV